MQRPIGCKFEAAAMCEPDLYISIFIHAQVPPMLLAFTYLYIYISISIYLPMYAAADSLLLKAMAYSLCSLTFHSLSFSPCVSDPCISLFAAADRCKLKAATMIHTHTHTHTLTHSLTLSLSHTHTHVHIYDAHTHTHTHTHSHTHNNTHVFV